MQLLVRSHVCGSIANRHEKPTGSRVCCCPGKLSRLDAIAQPPKIVEGLNFHWLRSRRNSDNEDLVLILLHSLVDVCEMNEVIFRYQGVFAVLFVVDGDRPSCTHGIFPQNYSTLHFG